MGDFVKRESESKMKEKIHKRIRINGHLMSSLSVLFSEKTITKVAITQVMTKNTDLLVISL